MLELHGAEFSVFYLLQLASKKFINMLAIIIIVLGFNGKLYS